MHVRRWVLITVVLLVALGLVGLAFFGRPVAGPPVPGRGPAKAAPMTLLGQVEAAKQVVLTAPVEGRVVALLASEGAVVKAGEAVLQLRNESARAKLQAAQKTLAGVERRAQKAPRSETQRKLEAARIHLEGAQAGLSIARQELAEFKSNHPTLEKDLETLLQAQQEVERKRAAFEEVRREFAGKREAQEKAQRRDPAVEETQRKLTARDNELRIAQQRLKGLGEKAQPLYEQGQQLGRLSKRARAAEKLVAQSQDEVNKISGTAEGKALVEGDQQTKAARQAMAEAEKMVGGLMVKAPQAGTLARLNTRPGERVKAGQQLAVVEQAEEARLVFNVPGQQLEQLRVGRRLEITPQGGKRFTGAIDGIVAEEGRVIVKPLEKVILPPPGTALVAVVR
ncbi:MAG: HlyD family efflux transporter periplasmic adaptor subunit [Armatimonadia bacterium]